VPNALPHCSNCVSTEPQTERIIAVLLSHTHRFIFVKTRKTAGTSVEADLSKVMGPRDVVTMVYPAVEGHRPRNFKSLNPLRRLQRKHYYNHMPARLIREFAGRKVFDAYFKFCIEREPVAKTLSQYNMITKDRSFKSFDPSLSWEEYLERGNFPVDAHLYLDQDGALMVDRILAYEKLGAELAEVTASLGIVFAGLKAQAKAGSRSSLEVTPQQRQLIYVHSRLHCLSPATRGEPPSLSRRKPKYRKR